MTACFDASVHLPFKFDNVGWVDSVLYTGITVTVTGWIVSRSGFVCHKYAKG